MCGNNIIEQVSSYVYLGINLDDVMSMTVFANTLYNRLQLKLFTLSKVPRQKYGTLNI